MNRTTIFTVLCIASASAAWGGWTIETVASQGDVGAGCSLAVDRWGRPHISYMDKTNGSVNYAVYAGSTWDFWTVAEDVEVTGNTALALDAFDRPHVLFKDPGESKLVYAYRSGTTWNTEEVDSGEFNANIFSIVTWPSEPRVSYFRTSFPNTYLKYGYREGSSWNTENVVDSGGGEFNTVFVDDNGKTNIVFFNGATTSVKHAIRNGTTWALDDISEGIDCDATPGPQRKVHVSFANVNNTGLDYAVSTAGGSWNIENVKAATGAPGFTHIRVNGAGDIFISYFNWNKHNLHIVKKSGGSWKHELVARGNYVGLPHSLAIGSGGHPLIAFYDSGKGDLKLARYDPLTDVEVTSFTTERSRAGADVRWTVSGGGDAAGYNLYRAATGAERAKVNLSLITGSSPFLFRDAAAESAVGYRYWLELVPLTGTSRTYGPVSLPPAGKAHAFALYQNVPNPVSGSTTFSFELAEGSNVKFAIYDAAGRKVADVADGYFAPGQHDVPFSLELAPGVYVYRLDAGANVAARKMVVVE
ncbi:MAG: T9SS type A sorting domain-containing protein [bacterium]